MALSFSVRYEPAWQKRYGKCGVCHQGIEAGEKIMLGKGFFNGIMIQVHFHYKPCWVEEVQKKANDWYFQHPYQRKLMEPELKARLNRLRSQRYYIQHKKGGDPNEKMIALANITVKIALAKHGQ
jgi:hypothetical protein